MYLHLFVLCVKYCTAGGGWSCAVHFSLLCVHVWEMTVEENGEEKQRMCAFLCWAQIKWEKKKKLQKENF